MAGEKIKPGAASSLAGNLPTANANTEKRVSPAAIVSMVGKKLDALTGGKGKAPKVKGMPGGQRGGGRGDGTKRLLLAIFGIEYGKWTNFCKHVVNGTLGQAFGENLPQTKENRVLVVFGQDGSIIHQCLDKELVKWLKKEHKFDSVIAPETTATVNKGAYTMPAGLGYMPFYQKADKTEDRIGSFVKNADLAEYYGQQAAIVTDEAKKAEYTDLAAALGNRNKYGGFCCATTENAATVAKTVRDFYAMNPEFTNDFVEMQNWTAVYGQAELADVANEYWPNTAEAAAAAAAQAQVAPQA